LCSPERELPKVRDEVRTLLKSTEKSIAGLGEERPTISHMRLFLSRLAMRYHNLTNAALIGDYNSPEFEFVHVSSSESRGLRAFVHSVNTGFSNKMRLQGSIVKIVSEPAGDAADLEVDLQEIATRQDLIQQISMTDARFTR
jgi:hypothetical protein